MTTTVQADGRGGGGVFPTMHHSITAFLPIVKKKTPQHYERVPLSGARNNPGVLILAIPRAVGLLG